MGATSGDINQSVSFVEIESYLSEIPTASRTSGDRAFVRLPVDIATTGQLFFLNRDSSLAVGPGVVLTNQAAATSPAGPGRWLSERMYGAGGGGGGECIIADGGTIAGEYACNMICEGDVTVTGALTVVGSVLVRGEMVNDGGFPVTILGGLTATRIDFEKAETSTPQSNVFVGGDLLYGYLNFPQCGGTAAVFFVGGDLIGNGNYFPNFYNVITVFNGRGSTPGTPGLDVIVCGDVNVSDFDISGADGSTPPNAAAAGGDGGNLFVCGDLKISGLGYFPQLAANGGDSDSIAAGQGGNVYVLGSIDAALGNLWLQGGFGTECDGGVGGYVTCYGTATLNYLNLDGGDCNSSSEMNAAGDAGGVYFRGHTAIYSFIASGGDRYGTLSVSNKPAGGADGGYADIDGDLFVGSITLNGGSVYTVLGSQPAGDGGYIGVLGNTVCRDDFRLQGGGSSSLGAGDGGYAQFGGDVSIGGNFLLDGGTNTDSAGGSGGQATVAGSLVVGTIDMSGGSGRYGGGGSGGTLTVRGLLRLTGMASFNGGSCDSNEEGDVAGSAGSLECAVLSAHDATVSLLGGLRYGSTTVGASHVGQGAGGYINAHGDVVVGTIECDAGDITTNYPNGSGGAGGDLTVGGTLTAEQFVSNGGSVVGDNGGSGGNLVCRGLATVDTVSVSGGTSTDSTGGGPDAQAGGPGGSVTVDSGIICEALDQQDGLGSAPTAAVTLNLRASSHIGTLAMTDRADAYINGAAFPTTLRVFAMPFKQTLNNSNGTQTANIAASLDSSIFCSGATGWYAVTGIGI